MGDRASHIAERSSRAVLPALLLLGCLGSAAAGGLGCNMRRGHSAAEVSGTDCATCHRDDFEAAVQPLHVQQLPLTCEDCHENDRWRPALGSDHDTFFPLKHSHAEAGCGACHADGFHAGATPPMCVDCHQRDYERAARPPHAGLPVTCSDCHDERAFSPATFDHPWPLEGEHLTVQCGSCHVGNPPKYAGTPSGCIDCHQADFEAADSPPHDGFSTDCSACHTPAGWHGADPNDPSFVHPWPLVGAHRVAGCRDCHGDPPTYAGTSSTCVDCHRADYEGAESPPHDGFSTDCSACHTPVSWRGATPSDPSFVHPWPLRGAHSKAACSGCHQGDPPVYEGTPMACVDCHAGHRDAAALSHDGFSDACTNCHTEEAFKPAEFEHAWPLTGAHVKASCADCHGDSPAVYAGTRKECVACHREDYDKSPFPGHDAFSTECADCHSTTGWTPASGAHPNNRFPITGRHDYACMECHNPALGPNGRGNADCVGCHRGSHSRARMDREHDEVWLYPRGDAPPNFCLDCHPAGREDD